MQHHFLNCGPLFGAEDGFWELLIWNKISSTSRGMFTMKILIRPNNEIVWTSDGSAMCAGSSAHRDRLFVLLELICISLDTMDRDLLYEDDFRSGRWPFDILAKWWILESWCLSLYRTTLFEESLSHCPWLLIKVSEESVHVLHRYGSRKCVIVVATFFCTPLYLCATKTLCFLDIERIEDFRFWKFC
jgi:hypothetical protein